MRKLFSVEELREAQLFSGFSFTKGCPVLKVPAVNGSMNPLQYGNKLFNLQKDPHQLTEISDFAVEQKMAGLIQEFMQQNDAPIEQYERMGIPENGTITQEELQKQTQQAKANKTPVILQNYTWEEGAYPQLQGILQLLPQEMRQGASANFVQMVSANNNAQTVTKAHVAAFCSAVIPPASQQMVQYLMSLWCRSH